MRKILPLVLLMSIIVIGLSAQGIALGQEEPTATSPPTETATDIPTTAPTETETIAPTETSTESPTESPTTVVETSTPTVESETPAPTDSGTITETATVTETITPTAAVETLEPTASTTPPPTLTMMPTGQTRMFFFQGLAGSNVDIYANGIQLGANVETGQMLGSFVLLDGTATTMLVFPGGDLTLPIIISTLAFEPGSTVLVVVFNGPGGIATLAVYRLDSVPGQSQVIAINASDAPSLEVVTDSGRSSSIVQGSSAQIALSPGSTANLTDATGRAAAQSSLAPQALEPGVAYLQIAVGSVANGTYRVITQTIDLNTLTPAVP